jgi:hypothetical protein
VIDPLALSVQFRREQFVDYNFVGGKIDSLLGYGGA